LRASLSSWFAFVTKLNFEQVIGGAGQIYRRNVNLMLKIEWSASIRQLVAGSRRNFINVIVASVEGGIAESGAISSAPDAQRTASADAGPII
jgi:hypothetical protein